MAYELTIKNYATFQNPKLNDLTMEMNNAISAVGAMAEKTKIMVARHLSTIDSEKLYEDDFQNTVAYCEEILGMSKSNAYAYIQVGRALNTETIPTTDANGTEFNFTQLRAMCAAKDVKKLAEAVDSGEISADMTGNDCEEAVKAMNPKRKPAVHKEKRFIWGYVGTDEATEDMTKSEVLGHMADEGTEVLGELKTGSGFYIVGISNLGFPVLIQRADEVKKVVEGEKAEG